MASVVEMLGAARRDAVAEADAGTADPLGANSDVAVNDAGPIGTVVVSDTALQAGEAALVIFTFSEAVVGFTNADVTAPNGTMSALSSSDGGITWTAAFTPAANVTDATNEIVLDNAGVTNLAGMPGVGVTVSNNFAIDTQRPQAFIVVHDQSVRVGEATLVTFTFSEAVVGFTGSDITVENGTLSGLSSTDGGVTWTASLTPTAGVTDATNLITLNNAAITDIAGNSGVGVTVSNSYAVDTQRPTATISVADTVLQGGQSTTVTFTFSEAVVGFAVSDITVENGTLSGLVSTDGGVTWTASLTPAAGVTDAANLITLSNAAITDVAGNAGVGLTVSTSYAVDTQRPTATISVADAVLQGGQSTTVTFTFSEAVTGFQNSGITVDNGTLSGLVSTDGGVTWTATFTPDTNVADATNVITVDMAAVTDVSGNAGVGVTVSNNYAVEDTQGPTATITMANTALKRGQSTTVTFTFSERVTGFDIGDVTVPNGRLSALSTEDGGLTYTATFTPKSYVRDSSNAITLNGTGAGVSDAAGNVLIGTAASANYSVQTVPGGFKGFIWSVFDFLVNDVVRPIGQFFHMLFFGPPPHLNHPLPVTPWSVDS